MLQALKVFGSDDTAQYTAPNFSMGRCLLRLLPEDRFDRQPLLPSPATALVADLRLDNRDELLRELKLSPSLATQMADSELLKRAWERRQEHCLKHLRGAFAFSVWREREQELLLVRDPMGERSLYYSTAGNCFSFSSTTQGLRVLPFVGTEIDEEYTAMQQAMLAVPIEETIFRRIRRLPSGCMLRVGREKVTVERYWESSELAPLRLKSDQDYLEDFRERFDEAVRSRLRTTGKIGAELSGGLDSSSVAATAASMLQESGRELTAYTAVPRVGFEWETATHFGNEGPAAAELARMYPNIRHICVRSSETSFLDVIDRKHLLYDNPCRSPLNEVWLEAISERARADGVKVILTGQSGNFTFSYEGLPALSTWLSSGHWLTLARTAYELRKSGSASLKLMLRHAAGPLLPFWLRRIADPHIRGFSLDSCALHPAAIARLDLKRRALREGAMSSPDGRYLLHLMLVYGDISGTVMASQGGWQFDTRDPTFDQRVVEFCLTVPLEQFLRGGQMRSLARRAMVGRLPEATLKQRRRGRQSADWFLSMTAVRPRLLGEIESLKSSPMASRLLDLAWLRRLVEQWPTGSFDRPEIEGPYFAALPRAISMGRFLRMHDPEAKAPISSANDL